jgi:hypothetical protein
VELGSRGNADYAGGSGGDAVHGLPVNQSPQVESAGASDKPAGCEQSPEPEQFVFEPAPGEQQPSTTTECFFEQQIIADVSNTDDYVRKTSEQSRPESFIIDNGSAIIW